MLFGILNNMEVLYNREDKKVNRKQNEEKVCEKKIDKIIT